ncbi:hypothetical protein G6F65_020225 [Rhizopus arrhizus]|nr:hypothetical protein G6F65_020225 [Rhizopus arrhizus]
MLFRSISSVAPGGTVDSKTTMHPGRSTGPIERHARTSKEKSGLFFSSTGVGTATTKKSQPSSSVTWSVNCIGEASNTSRSISPVQSSPSFSRAIRRLSTSKPMTSKRLENATATGRPSYPRPHTAILFTTGDLTVFIVSQTLEIDAQRQVIDVKSK